MSKNNERTNWFYNTILKTRSNNYAIMQPPDSDAKYIRVKRHPDLETIRRHLNGMITIAVPVVTQKLAHQVVLDIDGGGMAVIRRMMKIISDRGLYCYGTYNPRQGWDEEKQRGYVYIPFSSLVEYQRLHQLGEELTRQMIGFPIENRVCFADTRVFFGIHRHTGKRGTLVLPDEEIEIDAHVVETFDAWRSTYQENDPTLLPEGPEGGGQAVLNPMPSVRGGIRDFNKRTNIEHLLEQAGARRASRGLWFCPFHDDTHASLTVFISKSGKQVARCLSAHSNCPLSGPPHDAYDIARLMGQSPPPSGRELPAGYECWEMGGVWYATTAMAPSTSVGRGFRNRNEAIQACLRHRREKNYESAS